MTTYNVFCDGCAAEYSVTPLAGSDTPPTNCAYCGSTITEEAISEKDEEWTDEDWDKLIDDEWSSEDDR
jgi:rRNA maturation endonuclease Nob1